MNLSSDRRTGVLVAAACADALGAGYEFGGPMSTAVPVEMRGQGAFAPGEWTDDTAQLIAIALAAADGHDLDSDEGLDAVARNLLDWYLSPASDKDIGIHTAQVFRGVTDQLQPGLAEHMREVAIRKEQANPQSSGGNGALMRTAPVALALWQEPERMVRTAMLIAGMTHADERSSQACAVWCLAIRRALMTDDPADLQGLVETTVADVGVYLGSSAMAFWDSAFGRAHRAHPQEFYGARPNNGYCVTALQAAWAAISSTQVPTDQPGRHLRLAIEAAVRGGGDTDTVACIAGAVLGALWGASAVPLDWRRRVFGWPHMMDRELVELADAIDRGRTTDWPQCDHFDYSGWSRRFELVAHPHDPGVLLSGAAAAQGEIPIDGEPIGAVVSLCRIGRTDLDHFELGPGSAVEVWLIDTADGNPNLDLVLRDAADAVHAFRQGGRRVLLHCVESASRTPSVAAMYSVLHLGIEPETAIKEVLTALPNASPQPAFLASVRRAWDN